MSDIHALSGAYAVDALDEHERELFERHLAECADCRAEVESLREASAMLTSAVAVPPPPSLRDSVLAGISTVRPLPPVVPVTPRGRRFPLLVAAAAAVIALVGGGFLIADRGDDAPVSVASRVVAADDVRTASVTLGSAKATVYRSPSVGRAVIVTENMPPAPEGKVYELWLQVDGAMVPAGLMPRKEDQTYVLEGDASRATAAGITVEPAGGSEQPTTEPIALFPLDS